ncbi:uncharacterized protein isoform X2 [Musca autumnalis]|uniref:uncharacterized protein isoform X2 n=1 Tax=Musca autumnalis TaxID=221902 RepID=UPI003CEF15FF
MLLMCGMRHPNTGLSEDDLSRLTGSSSSSASCRSNNCKPTSSSSSSSSSSASSSSSSSSASSSGANTPEECKHINKSRKHHSPSKQHHHHVSTIPSEHLENNKNTHHHHHHNSSHQEQHSHFNSTYLPEIINPLEWQKSRKRKERLDSTSSTIQDRKLQRSNSEELLPPQEGGGVRLQNNNNVASTPADLGVNALKSSLKNVENIRRVSSEDFKRTPYEVYEQELRCEAGDHETSGNAIGKSSDENDGSLANRQHNTQQQQQQSWTVGVPIKDMTRRSRYETSPARSQRHSPIRVCFSNGNGIKQLRDSDDSECEHERRRSSERFCKSRAPPGRKASGVTKKSTSSTSAMKYLPSKLNDENVYKYDLSALKYERRGFISKKSNPTNQQQQQQHTMEKSLSNDLNDNNLIDFTNTSSGNLKSMSKNLSPTASSNGSTDDVHHNVAPQMALPKSATTTPSSANSSKSNSQSSLHKLPIHHISAQESLPWDRSVPEDQTPVLSRRYATVRPQYVDSIDTAAKLSKVKPYPQPYLKQNPITAQLLANELDDDDVMDPSLTNFRAFTTLENIKTRELMQQVLPNVMSFQSPEERMRQINKRVTALKKKLMQLEDSYEQKSGYKPSQADRLNDKYMKHILSELSKLRKERHELKTDPMSALGLKVSGGMDAAEKLQKMKVTLMEIEQSLAEKRKDHNRPEVLDELTADQLVQEKTTVQHGLLFFESLYGRPSTKDERDAARPLYDRYRQLKRLVSRSVTLSGCSAAGAPELPTILEHEAMVFESTTFQYSSANSTETTNSPTDSVVPNNSSDESTTTTTAQSSQQQQEQQNETISCLSIEKLWEQLEKTREEKKHLKRVIREYETVFEEENGRKMLKSDRKTIEETYAQYKEKKAKTRLLQALIKKQISR